MNVFCPMKIDFENLELFDGIVLFSGLFCIENEYS